MSVTALIEVYRAYLECLNHRCWSELGRYVDDEVRHNGRRLGLAGYREMLIQDCTRIPDLQFDAQLLVCEPPRLAARLHFDCVPSERFLGLDVAGRRISFSENVFYEFSRSKIGAAWSVIDKMAIEAQLDPH